MAYYPFTKSDKDKYGIRVTSPYGMRASGFHGGTDYAPRIKNTNIPIIASEEGTVSTGRDSFGGLWSYVRGKSGRGYLSVHHSKFLKTKGPVKAGEAIAIMGTTGHSTGIHTHFEIRKDANNKSSKVDPEKQGLTYFDLPIINDDMTLPLGLYIKLGKDSGLLKTVDKPAGSNEVATNIPKGVVLHATKVVTGYSNIGINTTFYIPSYVDKNGTTFTGYIHGTDVENYSKENIFV